MKYKKMYGNPYTGFTSTDKQVVINSLKAMGKRNPFKESHRVHYKDKVYVWIVGKGRLK